jgi:hypothetical protein
MFEIRTQAHEDPHVQYLLMLSDFNQNWNVPTHFSKTLESQTS